MLKSILSPFQGTRFLNHCYKCLNNNALRTITTNPNKVSGRSSPTKWSSRSLDKKVEPEADGKALRVGTMPHKVLCGQPGGRTARGEDEEEPAAEEAETETKVNEAKIKAVAVTIKVKEVAAKAKEVAAKTKEVEAKAKEVEAKIQTTELSAKPIKYWNPGRTKLTQCLSSTHGTCLRRPRCY